MLHVFFMRIRELACGKRVYSMHFILEQVVLCGSSLLNTLIRLGAIKTHFNNRYNFIVIFKTRLDFFEKKKNSTLR